MLNEPTLLASTPFTWSFGDTHNLTLQFNGKQLQALVDGKQVFEVTDTALDCGSVALAVEAGRSATQRIQVEPSN